MENNDSIRLVIKNVVAGYGRKETLCGASLKVSSGEIVLLVGPNGSGKSTLLKVVAGLLRTQGGQVEFQGEDISQLQPHDHIERGIAYLMQGGEVFPSLTVIENLRVSGHRLQKNEFQSRFDWVTELFPKLKELRFRRAGLLSGGERQMLALGMILLHKPKLLLLDEPSAGGLSADMVREVFRTIKKVSREENVGILLVEQNIREAVKIADRVYILKDGKIYCEDHPLEILRSGRLKQVFFGASIAEPLTDHHSTTNNKSR